MIQLSDKPVIVQGNTLMEQEEAAARGIDCAAARQNTLAWNILAAHNTAAGDDPTLRLRFDALASHDITYVGIIQTARASGLERFPMPYALTNCHNSLCAVGGTINEDDHLFGLSAAKKYGGVYVPPHLAVIHQYMREMYAGCGRMILGSDSHTRYGALGTMAIGEGGGELAKQLLNRTYDVACPGVVAVHLTGAPVPGVGPQDVALAIIGAVFASGYVKNKVMEFVGPGVASLPLEYRSGIDVMTTETTCLSSIWVTDEVTRKYLAVHGREGDYKPLAPADLAYYDGVVEVALDKVRPMIALPMHPSNVYTIEELNANLEDILHKTEEDCAALVGGKVKLDLVSKIENGRLRVDQGVIAGCAGGTWSNICEAAQILEGFSGGNGEYALSVYPSSQPTMMALMKNGALASLMAGGATVRTAFCGPCFGAGDVPANGAFSIRHSTRNFPNREGSKPSDGQVSYVALMDARSIAATARNGGVLTGADELPEIPADPAVEPFAYDDTPYKARVYFGVGKPDPAQELVFGPNIADWPEQVALPENLLLTVCSAIYDPVTTTDELIPSGETSSYRSNPLRLAEFALSRKDPQYVPRAKQILAEERRRRAGEPTEALLSYDPKRTGLGSLVMALRPGDGSAREQAASCQRVLGGCANIAQEYATKRYRSNVVNWGMLPFLCDGLPEKNLQPGDQVYIPGIRALLEGDGEEIAATLLQDGKETPLTLKLPGLTREERDIILAGCLINYYAQ